MERRQKAEDVYLLGPLKNDQITGNKLPSNKQVLCRFLYLHRSENKTVREASTLVIHEVAQFWERAIVPIKPQQQAIKKLESLHDEYKRLKSHKNRTKNAQKNDETQFCEKFDDELC